MVHEVAEAGFGDASDYEAARPSYPAEAVHWFTDQLGLEPGRRVCDFAAGTGKFTRLLKAIGANLIAVEPVAGMRTEFRRMVAGVPLLAGTAEAAPFADGVFDAVLVAQAWHWFDHDRAGVEMRRIVRPAGGVGLIWNARDRGVPWVDAIWAIMDRVEKRAPWRDHDNWRASARTMPGFGAPRTAEFRHVQPLSREQVVQRIASVSHVAVLPERDRASILDEVRAVLDHDDTTRGRDTVELPYRVDCIAYGPA